MKCLVLFLDSHFSIFFDLLDYFYFLNFPLMLKIISFIKLVIFQKLNF